MLKFCFLLLVLFLFNYPLAYSAEGCLVSNGTVYTAPEGSAVNILLGILLGKGYKGDPVPSSTSCISGSMNVYIAGSSKCRVCPGEGFSIINLITLSCSGTPMDGYISNETVISCNLDDYTSALVAGFGVLGFIIIKRKNIF